jgi:saccharopine dehydrogenase (NADP+, L-glutamate forming)
MERIDRLRGRGHRLECFKSFTGGLIAPESNDNPWNYKFTWNPRNVVLAGQGTAQYLKDGRYKYIPYNRVFRQTEYIHVDGLGELEAYANRDSLLYKSIYGLDDIPTLIRGTLRYPGFCRAWDALVRLGWTDDSYPIIDAQNMTYRKMVEAYLEGVWHEYPEGYDLKKRLADFLKIDHQDEIIRKLDWLGIFEDKRIGMNNASPAEILQALLLEKWQMQPDDKDMVVMQHRFIYKDRDQRKRLLCSLVMKGENSRTTAMSKLVGLPVGVFVKQIMLGKIQTVGVHIPVIKDIYEPVLDELAEHGVVFEEREEEL